MPQASYGEITGTREMDSDKPGAETVGQVMKKVGISDAVDDGEDGEGEKECVCDVAEPESFIS